MWSSSAYVLLASLSCFCGIVSTHSVKGYDYGHSIKASFRKREAVQSSVVGSLPLVDGRPVARVEIRDLQKDDDQWNLYILALSWMQYTPQESPFSWYQIAGIHGAPGLTWGDVPALPGNEKIGYCHHVSILFPSWHRPYLMLYEQVLYNIVQNIASLWPPEDLDRVQKAAKRFRVPYWDWAVKPPAGESVFPLSVSDGPNVNVSGPNGVQTISNPLFSFIFRPFNGSVFPDSPYNKWNETKRAPNPPTDPNAISNNSLVAASFDSHLPSYQQRLYNLFVNYPNFTHFSNEAWMGSNANGSFDSVESLHDSVHTVGGGVWGHLAIIAYSAFDPLFFLHHTNIDRIFAMWQTIHNDSYVVPTAAAYASHTQMQGDMEDVNTPLQPFFVNNTSFWTSAMVRDYETFGYTYPETDNKTREEVIAAVNRLYTDYSPATMAIKRNQNSRIHTDRSVDNKVIKASTPEHVQRSTILAWGHEREEYLPTNVVFKTSPSGQYYREWVANIEVKKHALNTSFSLYLFMGDIPEDSSSWQSSTTLVGSLGILAGQFMGAESGKVTGTIPLTSALMRMITEKRVQSLEIEDVKPLLQSVLKLGVVRADGTVVGAFEVDGLCVSVVSAAVTIPDKEYELPRWGEVESIYDLAILH